MSSRSTSDTLNHIKELTRNLCKIPGLSGHEHNVAKEIRNMLGNLGISSKTDVLGNLFATIKGQGNAPSILVFTHMDQPGFVVRKIEDEGFIRFERVGGIPEKSLAAQRVVISTGNSDFCQGIIATKSHHATTIEEKYTVLKCRDLVIDAGFASRDEVLKAGIRVGSPIVYKPWMECFCDYRMVGTAIDDRAGCAVLLEVARHLIDTPPHATVHLLFSVQEEFNLRAAVPVARRLKPDIAVQIDLMLTADTHDMCGQGNVRLGGGPGMSLYSFHGRGTLNGVIPHPGLVRHFETTAEKLNISLQRNIHMGALTDLSYIQNLAHGIACLDIGFPMRYSHSSAEMCDLRDLEQLVELLDGAVHRISWDDFLARD